MKLVESSLTEDHDVLRCRLADEGCLFFRGVVGDEVVARLRVAARRAARAANLLDPDGRLAKSDVHASSRRSVKLLCNAPDFRNARYAPSIRALVRAVGASRHHPAPHSAYARFVPPRDHAAQMAAHQDQHFLSKPTDFVTVWIPVMMPKGSGGIAIARGSHAGGRVSHSAGRIVQEPREYASAEYRAGDAIVFSAYTIHKSIANHSRALRVSVDYRYLLERSARA